MTPIKRGSATVVLLALGLLAMPSWAAASTVQVTSDGALRIDGAPGENNRIQIFYKTAAEAGFENVSDRIVVEDDGAIPTSQSPNCVVYDQNKVSCDARGVTSIQAFLGDGDDIFLMYRTTKDAPQSKLNTFVHGGPGNDVLRGGDGVDRMFGEGGRDVLSGALGNDVLSGGPDSDALIGFGGNDVLSGGPGPDALFGQRGHDVFLGGTGLDVLLARDGIHDRRIDCGPGGGRALLDNRDPKAHGCGKAPRKGK
jgi:Ca2+-binding RTX toxin-like protein